MVRQYGQFMALMNNYDYFKENVGVAKSSTGALEKQAEIYAESWEAAEKRVRAAAEGVYKDLIDDKFFISLNNGFADIISGLDAFIEKAGGLKTIIIALSGILLSNFANKIPDAISKVSYNFNILTKGSEAAYKNILNQMNESSQKQFQEYRDSFGRSGINEDSSMGLAIKQANALSVARMKYQSIEDKLTEAEKAQYQIQLNTYKINQQEILAQAEKNDKIREQLELQKKTLTNKTVNVNKKDMSEGLNSANSVIQDLTTQESSKESENDSGILLPNSVKTNKEAMYQDAIKEAQVFYNELSQYREKINDQYTQIHSTIMGNFSNGKFYDFAEPIKLFKGIDFKEPTSEIAKMVNSMESLSQKNIDGSTKIKAFQNQLKALASTIPSAVQKATGLNEVFQELGQIKDPNKLPEAIERLKNELSSAEIPAKKFKEVIQSWDGKSFDELIKKYEELETSMDEVNAKAQQQDEKMNQDFNPTHFIRTSEALGSLTGLLASSTMGLNSFISGVINFTNTDLSPFERFSSLMFGISSGVTLLGNAYKIVVPLIDQFVLAQVSEAAMSSLSVASKAALTQVLGKEKLARLACYVVMRKSKKATEDQITTEVIAKLSAMGITDVTKQQEIARELNKLAIDKENMSLLQQIALQAVLHPGWAALGAAIAIVAGVIGYNFVHAQENANKAIDDANEKYEEQKNKLEELNNELEEINKQINELNNKDELSLVDKQTLKDLKSQKAILEAQLKIAQQMANIKQKDQANIISKNWSKSFGKNQMKQATVSDDWGNEVNLEDYINQVGYDLNLGTFKDDSIYKNVSEFDQQVIIKKIKDAQAKQLKYISDFQEQFNKNEENYLNILDAASSGNYTWKKGEKEQFQADLKQQRLYMLQNNQEDYEDTYLKPIFDSIDPSNLIAQSKLAMSQFDTSLSDSLGVTASEFEEYFNNGIKKTLDAGIKGITEDTLKGLSGEQLYTLINNLDLLQTMEFDNVESLKDYLDGVIVTDQIQEAQEVISNIKQDLSDLVSITQDLNIGDILSQDEYELLLKYNEALKDYFIYTGMKNGKAQYKYIGGADEEIASIGVDEAIEQMQKANAVYNEVMGSNIVYGRTQGGQDITYYDWMHATGDSVDTGALRALAGSDINWSDVGDGSYNSESINSIADDLDSVLNDPKADEATKQAAINKANLFLSTFKETLAQGSVSDVDAQQEMAYSTKSTLNELDEYNERTKNAEAYSKQLVSIARGYDEDSLAAEKYQNALNELKKSGKNLNDVNKAYEEAGGNIRKLPPAMQKVIRTQKNLIKEIKKAEWDKFTEKALSYAQALENTKNVDKQLKGIQKAFKNTKGMEVSMDTLQKYKDLLIEWGKAGIDASDDIMTAFEAIANLEKMQHLAPGSEELQEANNFWNQYKTIMAENSEGVVEEVGSKFTRIQDLWADTARILSENKPQVDINGNADFSAAIAEMVNAGYTAADIATALNHMGQLTMTFDAEGTALPLFDGTVESAQNFVNAFNGWRGTIHTTGNAKDIQKEVAKRFGGGTGGGSHSAPTSGSSGGGGSKSTSHADQKNYTDKDRYHTIKNQLEDLTDAYDDVNKAKERAFGKNRLNYIDQEIAKTDKLIAAQEEYLREIEKNLPDDKAIMEKAYGEYIGGPAMQFDDFGNISNFDEIQDAMFKKYNDMAKDYTDDDDNWKTFEKQYELLEKYIEQYEETQDLAREQKQELQDLLNQKIDLGLEKIQYSVEVSLDIPDNAIKILEYKLSLVDDDALQSVKAVKLLTEQADEVYKKMQTNKQAINDILKLTMGQADINKLLSGNLADLFAKEIDKNGKEKYRYTFTEDQINALAEYRDNLIDLNQELDDIRENIEEKVVEAFDAWTEKLNNNIDKVQHYQTVISSFRNMIDIVGKDTLGITSKMMQDLSQKEVDGAIDNLKATKTTYEAIVKARQEAEDQLNAAQDEASKKMWQDTLDHIDEEMQSASETMMQAWEDALQGLADAFENSVNDIVDTFNKSIYQFGGLEGLSNDFSKAQDNADLMLDDYQKIYELSKLNRDINKTIDDTDSISGKQKLKKLLQQINDIQEDGNEMSKYDLEYLQKTYDLRKAEIELEEAQRAKNTVRLQKDSEGNWSYIYTQSSDAIDSAQQKYEDALYAMQDLSSNYIDEMSEKLISTSQDMQEALAAIRVSDYANLNDYYAEVQRVQDSYKEQLDKQQAELDKAIANNKLLYDQDWKNYHDATGYKISDQEDFVTSFKDSLLGQLLGSESDVSNFNDIIADSANTLMDSLNQTAANYYQNLEAAMKAAGTSTKDFTTDMETALGKLSNSIKNVVGDGDKKEGTINSLKEQMNDAFTQTAESVETWQKTYGEAMEKVKEANLGVAESINKIVEALTLGEADYNIKFSIDRTKASESDIPGGDKNKTSENPTQLDTGGYTGNWGTSGKLAVLHEKELVLNAEDTANMLTAVQITRAMLDTIDLNARQASFGLGNLIATSIKDEKSNTLQQQVAITAEFPNVQNHTEIEEAFNNLINQASQYAYRK